MFDININMYQCAIQFTFSFPHDHGAYHDGDGVFHDAYDCRSSLIIFLQDPSVGFET